MLIELMLRVAAKGTNEIGKELTKRWRLIICLTLCFRAFWYSILHRYNTLTRQEYVKQLSRGIRFQHVAMSPSTNLLQNESKWMELERSWWWIGSNAIFIGGYMLITVPLSEKPCSDFEHWYRRHRILTVHSLEAKNGKVANLKKMMNSRYPLHLRTLRLAGRIKCQWLIDRLFTDMLIVGEVLMF